MSAIAQQAKEIVADNGLQAQVTIIQAKIEDVELPVAQVYYPLGILSMYACSDSVIIAKRCCKLDSLVNVQCSHC